MEPASPLKSITNTAQLAPPQNQSNGVGATTNGINKSIEENNSWWKTNATLSNGSVNSRIKQNPCKIDLFSSTNDNNNLFNNSHHTTNGISLNNGINLSSSDKNGLSNGFHGITSDNKQQNVITKNGFEQMSPSSSSLSSATSNLDNSNHLFTPDSDFVADFSSANIFNAMNTKSMTNGNPIKPVNGHTNGIHINGIDKLTNGNQLNGHNGFTTNGDENFADFEHNTIYNAAGKMLMNHVLDLNKKIRSFF